MKPYGGNDKRACTCCGSPDKRCRARETKARASLIDEGLIERERVPGEDTTVALADGYGCPWCGGDHLLPSGPNFEPMGFGICEPGYGLNVGHVAPGGDA